MASGNGTVGVTGLEVSSGGDSTATYFWFHRSPAFHVEISFRQQFNSRLNTMCLAIYTIIRWQHVAPNKDPYGIRQYMRFPQDHLYADASGYSRSFYPFQFCIFVANNAADMNSDDLFAQIYSSLEHNGRAELDYDISVTRTIPDGHIGAGLTTNRYVLTAVMPSTSGKGIRPDDSHWGGSWTLTDIPISEVDGNSILVFGGCPASTCENNEIRQSSGFYPCYGYYQTTRIGPIFRVGFDQGTFYTPPKNFVIDTLDCCTGETVGARISWEHGTLKDDEILRARLVPAERDSTGNTYHRYSGASPFITVTPDELSNSDTKISGMYYLTNSLFGSQYADKPNKKFRIKRGTPYYIDAYVHDGTTGFAVDNEDMDKGDTVYSYYVGTDMGGNAGGRNAVFNRVEIEAHINEVLDGFYDKLVAVGLHGTIGPRIQAAKDSLIALCRGPNYTPGIVDPADDLKSILASSDNRINLDNQIAGILNQLMYNDTTNIIESAKDSALSTIIDNEVDSVLYPSYRTAMYELAKVPSTTTYDGYLRNLANYAMQAAFDFSSDSEATHILALTEYYDSPDYTVDENKVSHFYYVITGDSAIIGQLANALINALRGVAVVIPTATPAFINSCVYNDTGILINTTDVEDGTQGELGNPAFAILPSQGNGMESFVSIIYAGLYRSTTYTSPNDDQIGRDYTNLISSLKINFGGPNGSFKDPTSPADTFVAMDDAVLWNIIYYTIQSCKSLKTRYTNTLAQYSGLVDDLNGLENYLMSRNALVQDIYSVPTEDPKPASLNSTYSVFFKYTDFSTLNINGSMGVNHGYDLAKSLCYSIVMGTRSNNLYGNGAYEGVYDFNQDKWLDDDGFTIQNNGKPLANVYHTIPPSGNTTELPDGITTQYINGGAATLVKYTDGDPTTEAVPDPAGSTTEKYKYHPGKFTNLDQDRVYEVHVWAQYPNRSGDAAKFGNYPAGWSSSGVVNRAGRDMVNEVGERDTEEVFYVKTLRLGSTTALGEATIHQHYILTKWRCDVIPINDLNQYAAKRNDGTYLHVETVQGDTNPNHVPVIKYIINNRDASGSLPHVEFYFVGAGDNAAPPLVHDGGVEVGCSFIHCPTPTNESILNVPTDLGPADALPENRAYYTYNTYNYKVGDPVPHGYNGWSYGDYNKVYETKNMLEHDPDLDKNPDWIYVPTSINSGILISYWCEHWTWYDIICALTDGHNVSNSKVTVRTTFPYIWIYDKATGQFQKAMPMVYDSNIKKYRLLAGYTYDNQPASDGTHYKEFYGEKPIYNDSGSDWYEKQTNKLP